MKISELRSFRRTGRFPLRGNRNRVRFVSSCSVLEAFSATGEVAAKSSEIAGGAATSSLDAAGLVADMVMGGEIRLPRLKMEGTAEREYEYELD